MLSIWPAEDDNANPLTSPRHTTALAAAEPVIQRLARKMFRRLPDAIDDAQQEARLHLLAALPRFDPTKGELAGFTFRVVNNALVDYRRVIRADHRQASALLDEVIADTRSGGGEQLAAELFKKPSAYLTKSKTKLFELLYVTDSHAELADILGISVDRLNERVCRLRHDLRELAS